MAKEILQLTWTVTNKQKQPIMQQTSSTTMSPPHIIFCDQHDTFIWLQKVTPQTPGNSNSRH